MTFLKLFSLLEITWSIIYCLIPVIGHFIISNKIKINQKYRILFIINQGALNLLVLWFLGSIIMFIQAILLHLTNLLFNIV